MIKKGTTRVCIVGKKYTYKFPIFTRGIIANYVEYKNYLENKDIVAYTEYHWWGLKQETLINTVVYDRYIKEVSKEHQFLFDRRLENRMQIGQDKDGNWKYYDYEDIKYYIK